MLQGIFIQIYDVGNFPYSMAFVVTNIPPKCW